MWSTTAVSANISNQREFSAQILSYFEIILTGVDSGYCGQYTCAFTDSQLNGTAPLTVGKQSSQIIE